jgi:hypothetical protein
MLLEDVSSDRSLSSVDFGKAAQKAGTSPKGIALPPPTEFIKAPLEILDADAALDDARREKDSLVWRARVQLRRVSDIAKDLVLRTWELLPKPAGSKPPDTSDEPPPVEVSEEMDLDPIDQADTDRLPTPAPFPIPREGRRPSGNQWEVTTQVVDMTRRRKSSRPGSSVPIEDLTLEEPKKKSR